MGVNLIILIGYLNHLILIYNNVPLGAVWMKSLFFISLNLMINFIKQGTVLMTLLLFSTWSVLMEHDYCRT